MLKCKNILAEVRINIAHENKFLTFREAEQEGIDTSLLIIKAMQDINILCGSQNTGEEIIIYANMIKNNFRSIVKVEEIIYVFQQIANGKYGKIYGKLNYNQLAEMIHLYIKDRSDLIDRKEESRKMRELSENNQRQKTDREISAIGRQMEQMRILAENKESGN